MHDLSGLLESMGQGVFVLTMIVGSLLPVAKFHLALRLWGTPARRLPLIVRESRVGAVVDLALTAGVGDVPVPQHPAEPRGQDVLLAIAMCAAICAAMGAVMACLVFGPPIYPRGSLVIKPVHWGAFGALVAMYPLSSWLLARARMLVSIAEVTAPSAPER